ncbi:MAG TPA: VTT domain-containing protein [Candidatus Limnocylindrales bacterium]|nr:VTT domain-containing protein [Candidatus Limnocylindrales bacterium]
MDRLDGRRGLQLTPARLDRAQRWFRRWGPLAIAVARGVPGLRWAMAVTCGTLGVGYRTFWLSTAISASVWILAWLLLGVTFGDTVAGVVAARPSAGHGRNGAPCAGTISVATDSTRRRPA